jgi:serine/threonine-protein kinase
MTRPGDPPVAGDGPQSSLDAELGRILEAYLADLEAGRPVDPERLLAEHSALAEQLRSCLAVVNLADRVAGDSGPAAPASGGSALTTLGLGGDAGPRVYLREMPDEREPMIRPRSDAMPLAPSAASGRYQLQGEIARGGMGAVLKGRDVDLGRDLAIKVLLESHRDHPDVVRRFVEEAQIGGQLQHPGIVPVYELGAFPDRRPYFAMKLVKGRTLAALLQERPLRTGPIVGGGSVRRPVGSDRIRSGDGAPSYIGPDPAGRGTAAPPAGIRPPTEALPSYDDLPRLLSIFEQVCQTMAYAHARGVIHRDLKPSNIMVGSFGEVQVMDWGLAKVLPQGGVADEGGSRPARETVIMTVRSGPAGSDGESQAGSVLGTPSYMAPEQALGELDRIDERADVFGLGAILCEVLTGQPPFGGSTRGEIRARAARGDLTGALRRLDACGADAELIGLARDCLAVEPEQRPRNAGEVARRISAYHSGVQDRLRAAELARVEAQTRAEEERKRRRVMVALAASVVGLVVLGGGGWAYLAQQRAERRATTERGATAALAEAKVWRDQARKATATGNLELWATAVAAVRHARDLVAQGEADAPLRDQVNAEMIAFEREQREAQVERQLLDDLDAIRGNRSEHLDPKRSDAEYAAAFRGFGIDLDRLDPEEAGRSPGGRHPSNWPRTWITGPCSAGRPGMGKTRHRGDGSSRRPRWPTRTRGESPCEIRSAGMTGRR